jgi:hypothetical protein
VWRREGGEGESRLWRPTRRPRASHLHLHFTRVRHWPRSSSSWGSYRAGRHSHRRLSSSASGCALTSCAGLAMLPWLLCACVWYGGSSDAKKRREEATRRSDIEWVCADSLQKPVIGKKISIRACRDWFAPSANHGTSFQYVKTGNKILTYPHRLSTQTTP